MFVLPTFWQGWEPILDQHGPTQIEKKSQKRVRPNKKEWEKGVGVVRVHTSKIAHVPK